MLDKTDNAAAIERMMLDMGARAREAAASLSTASAERKHAALVGAAEALWSAREDVLNANAIDMAHGAENRLSPAMLDRLDLDQGRIRGICDGLTAIAALPDPVGRVLAEWDRPNGLHIERVATPLGVVGVIYESRPNVTADAGGLCLKAGNAVILRGGSDSFETSRAIYAALVKGIAEAGLPTDAIQLVPTTDRAAVGHMLAGLGSAIDVIVPRGGASLVGRVQRDARVPVFSHLEGIVHVYVDRSAKVDMAVDIVANSKLRRVGICGAAETLLVDRAAAETHLPAIAKRLSDEGCELRVTDDAFSLVEGAVPASEDDFGREFLDSIIAVKLVDGVGEAIAHIRRWSSSHTEAIVAEDARAVERFMAEIDSAILLHNASTQFADGGEFGMGAEIGIATGKMHARGPVGVEQLCSFKYRVRGQGQTRS